MSDYQFGDTVVVGDTSGEHDLCVIFIHGLGDNGKMWADQWDQLNLEKIKVICPTAPTVPVSINKGAKMPAWFDLPPMGPEMFTKIDEKGIGASIAHVFDTIEKECASGTSIGRIVIGGFSQGGCLAIQTVLRCKYELAGVVLMSAFMGPDQNLKPPFIETTNLAVPWIWGHGDADPIVPYAMGKWSSDSLKKMGVDLEWHCYPKQTHIASPEQFRHVADFLEKLRGNVKLKEAEGKLSEPGAVVIKSPVAAMTPKALENLPVDKIKEFVVDFMEQCNDRSRILKMALGAFD
mmetsp:Transcript_19105/g.36542  ORF Transcript_19105/g.36542 Transcript_19105/m.36542 type:complete len:292 (-) Transcript_19105:522-1397(-)